MELKNLGIIMPIRHETFYLCSLRNSVRLFIGTLFLITIFIIPVYGNTTNNAVIPNSTSNTIIHNSTGNVIIENSTGKSIIYNSTGTMIVKNTTLFDKLFNIELNVNSCQKNVTENCQIVSSKLDNLTDTSMKIKNEVNLDDNYTKIGLGLTAVSLWFVFWVFFVQKKQSKKLEKLVKEVHNFTDEQQSIKTAKRKLYSKMILVSLRFMDYKLQELVIQQKFRDNRSDERIPDEERKQIQIKRYDDAQQIFLDMNIEFEDILEIFGETVEKQYKKAWVTMRIQSSAEDFDSSDKVWEKINEIRQEFVNLKDLLMGFLDDHEKSTYSDLFDPTKYEKSNKGEPMYSKP